MLKFSKTPELKCFHPKKGKYMIWLMNVLINWMGEATIYLFIKSYIIHFKSYNLYVDYSLIKLKKQERASKRRKRKQLPKCLFSNVYCSFIHYSTCLNCINSYNVHIQVMKINQFLIHTTGMNLKTMCSVKKSDTK